MGLEPRHGVGGDGGGGAVAGGVQGVAQGADDQAAHQGRVAEPDLGLGGVDVDVHVQRVDVQEQDGGRVPVPRQKVGIGAAQGPLQQPVLHRAAVDEQILMRRIAARIGGQAGVARQAHPVPRLIDQQGVGLEVATQQGRQPFQPALVAGVFGGQAKRDLAVQRQGEGDGLVRHGLAFDLLRNGHGLGPFGLHELEPGGGGVEEVAHLDPRAVRAGEGGGGQGTGRAALDLDDPGFGLVTRPGGDRQAGDRADGGQGLAPEAQGVDAQQVHVAGVVGFQLGCGVALDGQGQFVFRDALAVVGDQDARQAPAVGLDLDIAPARVQGVLDQFLDGAGRPLDHLAGGDAVDGFGGEAADGHVHPR